MASQPALALRRAEAMNRLATSVAVVTTSFEIEDPGKLHPAALRDPQIAEIARLEQIGDLLEKIQTSKLGSGKPELSDDSKAIIEAMKLDTETDSDTLISLLYKKLLDTEKVRDTQSERIAEMENPAAAPPPASASKK